LKKKRDSLIKEFFTLIRSYKELKEATITQLDVAFENLHIAQAVSGVNRVKGLAYARTPTCRIDATTNNLMGVKIPKFTITPLESELNASLIGTTYYVDKAQESFTKLLPSIVQLAEKEQVIFTLAEEIKKTKRRVNALEFIKIPEMESQERLIKMQLAEIERESFARLKNVKRKIDAGN
jgi:V/A-type H+-transporting ATPase subunit D